MKHFTTIYLFLLPIFRSLHAEFRLSSTEGQVCETEYGGYGICKRWQHCFGASRSDKGNSIHCSRLRTCCTNHYSVESIRRRSWYDGSDPHLDNKYKPFKVEKKWDDIPLSAPLISSRTFSTSSPPSQPNDVPDLRIKGCGKRKTITDFIIGGRQADYWPWMAAIFFRPEGSRTSTFQCGGTVISKNYILTAAHCLIDGTTRATPQRITVRLGGLTPQGDGQARRVSQIKIHEGYRYQLHYDDIALLKLSQNIESKNIAPACLPSTGMYNSNFYQRNATILGWGLTDVLGISSSSSLRETMVPIVSNSRCKKRYEKLNALSLTRGIIETQICAGTSDGSRDACLGDSGGPLILQDKSGKWTVVGVVSFGYGCADADYPGVYTRVQKYLYWLDRNTDIRAKNS